MQKFNRHQGIVAPMDRENVDTDAIIPKQFLKSIKKIGFGVNLFDEWRYLDPGEPHQDPASRQCNPDFVLNLPSFRRCVATHRGDRKVQDFTCMDQFLTMALAQLTYRESLRDIEVNLRAQAIELLRKMLTNHPKILDLLIYETAQLKHLLK